MKKLSIVLPFVLALVSANETSAQELNAKVNINTAQISNTKKDVFDALKEKTQEFLNSTQWTEFKYQDKEKIDCTFNITVNSWSEAEKSMKCTLLLNVARPVYGSSYSTTSYSVQDNDFNFEFETSTQLNYNPDNLDNQYIALLAYYSYIIIGMDMDTFADMGGTYCLQTAEDIVTKAQNLGYEGWSAYDDSKNKCARLFDYMDGSMEAMRHLNYQYYRKGLDQMAESVTDGRKAIYEALDLLDEAHQAKSMSNVPLLFSEYKRDEIINIFEKQGTAEERDHVYDILFRIDPSQQAQWEKLKQ